MGQAGEDGQNVEGNASGSGDRMPIKRVFDPQGPHPEYLEVNGHQYHPSGKIYTPFDKVERIRMDLKHRLFRYTLDGQLTVNTLPPDVENILDIGTGTGIWCREMAIRYPGANIRGVDITPIQEAPKPGNVEWITADVEDPWSDYVVPGSIDFIHIRTMAGAIEDWPRLIERAHEALKPGGQIEITELRKMPYLVDGEFAKTIAMPRFVERIHRYAQDIKVLFDPAPEQPNWLHELEFEGVTQRNDIFPLGTWAKEPKMATIAEMMTEIICEYVSTHLSLLFAVNGCSLEELEGLIEETKASIRDPEVKIYMIGSFTTARKSRDP